jgi:pimeloyl-ACP methyl ester carboxylesterase
MSEKYVHANGIRLAYEEFGDPSHPAMVLMMGLGTQLIGWPITLCEGLVARDMVGLLDALDIDKAHLVGASMGGTWRQYSPAVAGKLCLYS